MNRRRFLHLLTMAASAVAVSPYWTPTPELVEPPAPPPVYSGDPWLRMVDTKAGVSIRFISQFERIGEVSRIDVLYGWGSVIQPEWSMRVSSRLGARARRRAKRQQTIKIHPSILDVFVVEGINV